MAERKPKILCVDDEPNNLKLMVAILEHQGWAFETASNGSEAIRKTSQLSPDVILLDVMMPVMDGFEVCRRLKENVDTAHIPVVMVTALADRESKIRGLEAGANDFLAKPVDGTELMIRTRNLLKVKEYEDLITEYNSRLQKDVREKTSELTAALDELMRSQVRVREGYLDTIHRLTIVSEYRDEDTADHIRRVGLYCAYIADQFGWPDEKVVTIQYAAPMHDIGKVGIPAEILLKPARLNPQEFALMQTHTEIGAKIVARSSSAFLNMAERITLSHHERWDGTGYPRGLKEEEIPVEGRIMNIADQYDALRSRRPYKQSFDHDTAFKIITQGDGRTLPQHFDPKVLEVFQNGHGAFADIYESFKE